MSETLSVLGDGTRATPEGRQFQPVDVHVYYSGAGSTIIVFTHGIFTLLRLSQLRIPGVRDQFPTLGIDPRERIARPKIDISGLSWLGAPVFSNIVRETPPGWDRIAEDDGYRFQRNRPQGAVAIKPDFKTGLQFGMANSTLVSL